MLRMVTEFSPIPKIIASAPFKQLNTDQCIFECDPQNFHLPIVLITRTHSFMNIAHITWISLKRPTVQIHGYYISEWSDSNFKKKTANLDKIGKLPFSCGKGFIDSSNKTIWSWFERFDDCCDEQSFFIQKVYIYLVYRVVVASLVTN